MYLRLTNGYTEPDRNSKPVNERSCTFGQILNLRIEHGHKVTGTLVRSGKTFLLWLKDNFIYYDGVYYTDLDVYKTTHPVKVDPYNVDKLQKN